VSLVVLAMHFSEWLKAHLPRMRWLETMGRASLSVFCAHLVIVLMVLTIIGEPSADRPLWQDMLLFAGSVFALYVVARLVGDNKTRRVAPTPAPRAARLNSDAP
jgi:surface polysaccharide O-acyltransferase-like enzyme